MVVQHLSGRCPAGLATLPVGEVDPVGALQGVPHHLTAVRRRRQLLAGTAAEVYKIHTANDYGHTQQSTVES